MKLSRCMPCYFAPSMTFQHMVTYQGIVGHKACPICEEDTASQQLKHGRKIIYLRQRRFLRSHHSYRRLKKAFNGYQETSSSPTPLTGVEVCEKVNNIDHTFGKSKKKSSISNIWKKKSIFFDLPYWSRLEVKHCIDVMHVEKNVCDSLIGTLLIINGKTNDGVNLLELFTIGLKQY